MTSKGEGVSLVVGFVVLLGMFAGTLLYVRELQGRALMRIAQVEQSVAEVAECACAARRQLPDQPTP